MKKILVLAVMISLPFTTRTSAWAADEPLRSQSEVTVVSSSNQPRNAKVFQLANNYTLVTWQEVINGKYYLKSRTVSPTKALGAIQTLNGEGAVRLNYGLGNQDTVAIGRNGKVFATWITQGLRFGTQSQKIWGRTTTDGINWSEPFLIVRGLTVSGDSWACEDDPARVAGCGYLELKAAVDGKGRLAIMTLDNYQSTGTRYRVKATNFSGDWANYKTLSLVYDTRNSEITGLNSGFAANATNYNPSSTNTVRVNYYDPKSETWTRTFTATSTSANDVYRSHWVQRDDQKLTLAIAAEYGGIGFRDFSIKDQTWTGTSVEIQAPVADNVYQDLRAAKIGADLVVMYLVYDRNVPSTTVKAIQVSGSTPTTTVLEAEGESATLLYLGSDSTNNALVAFNLGSAGTKLGGITDGSLPILISPTFSSSAITSMTKTSTDLVLALGSVSAAGKTKLILLKGFAN